MSVLVYIDGMDERRRRRAGGGGVKDGVTYLSVPRLLTICSVDGVVLNRWCNQPQTTVGLHVRRAYHTAVLCEFHACGIFVVLD